MLGNSAYKFISLAYIQMLKSLTPVPTLLLAFLVGREQASLVLVAIVVTVTAGTAMASIGELNFSMIGFVLQVLSL